MVPAEPPVTIPVDAATVAVVDDAVLHVPPTVAFANVVVAPTQTFVAPVMATGRGLTINVVVVRQPSGNV